MRRPRLLVTGLVLLSACLGALAQDAPDGHRLMRFPDIHEDRVVFTYEGDLWLVPSDGGLARRITTHDGVERFARFSPDGRWLAFTGQYDGGVDVYLMPAEGGEPRRLTWHPASDEVLGFTPDGASVFFRSRREYPTRGHELYTVRTDGGPVTRLPIDRGGLADLSPDGSRVVYNRISREFRTWKRYRGGMAQDLWIADLRDGSFQKATEFAGTDSWPMWVGETIYFASDRTGTMNLWALDAGNGEPRPLTRYTGPDIKYPSAGPGSIVFQRAGALYRLDLDSGELRGIPVTLPSERLRVRPQWVDPSRFVDGYGLSPDGETMVVAARGDLFTVPAGDGQWRNITRTQGVREKNPLWSPDGETLAFFSDRAGEDGRREEELYVVDRRGESDPRRLTTNASGFRLPPAWSPDGRWLAFGDKNLQLQVVEVDTGVVRTVDQGEIDGAWEDWGIQEYVFSPDSRWLAYSKLMPNQNKSLFLYQVATGEVVPLTDDRYFDYSPSWDPDGDYLYFLSRRTFDPVLGSLDLEHVFHKVARPYVLILRDGEPSPFAEDGEEDDGDDADEDAADEEDSDETSIDLASPAELARRTVAVDVPAGEYIRLEAVEGGFLYLERTEIPFEHFEDPWDTARPTQYSLHRFELEAESDQVLMEGVSGYRLAAEGKRLAYQAGRRYGVVGAAKQQKVGDGKVDLSGLEMRLDRLAEYEQIFHEAWRVERDFFYDPGMHGVDWKAMRDRYAALLPYCGNRDDLNYLLGEMISELNAGHTYRGGGDLARASRVAVGLLGVELEHPPEGSHPRIRRILPGNNWAAGERSPLEAPGSPAVDGDYLLAIDGEPVRNDENPLRHLENKVGRRVQVTVGGSDDGMEPRSLTIEPLSSESRLRYRGWVESRRAVVEEELAGDVAYVHLPEMMSGGLREFAKVFYASGDRRGMIVDARYNGGGFVGDQILARLSRKVWAYTVPREGMTITNPDRALVGPLVLLINEETGSNGEYFAYAWKALGLGPVIGMRTWGGAVGIEPHQGLVDGGRITAPQFAPYVPGEDWIIEGYGVEPDIEVQNEPADVLAGRDPQLERAIAEMRALLEGHAGIPARPAFPDKSR